MACVHTSKQTSIHLRLACLLALASIRTLIYYRRTKEENFASLLCCSALRDQKKIPCWADFSCLSVCPSVRSPLLLASLLLPPALSHGRRRRKIRRVRTGQAGKNMSLPTLVRTDGQTDRQTQQLWSRARNVFYYYYYYVCVFEIRVFWRPHMSHIGQVLAAVCQPV